MRQISPGVLWIGNAFDSRDLKSVLSHRIQAIVDLAQEEPPIPVPRELIYCRFPLVDGQGNSPAVVEAAINTTFLFVTARIPTLISCGGGMSRSPAIAAAVMSRIDRVPPDEAMKRVAAEGPHDVAPLLWNEIREVLRVAGEREA